MPIGEIIIILALIVLNGFFAMAEMAVVSARRPRLQVMANGGDKGARRALTLAEDPARFLSSVQIGITLVGIGAGVFGGATLAEPLGRFLDTFGFIAPFGEEVAFAIVVIAITVLSLIVGELAPKRIALAAPERIAASVSGPLMVVAVLFRPFVVLLGYATNMLLRLFRVREGRDDTVTEAEVMSVIAEGTVAGAIDPIEQKMMEGVLRLADRSVKAVMTPRRDVFWIDAEDDPAVIRAELRECPWSRVVVVKGGNIDEPVGVVHKKDLLDAHLQGKAIDVVGTVKAPLFVPETTSVLKMLELFKTTPMHIAFVVDEFGSFEGLVTPTDVLSAIAGDLPDETGDAESAIRQRPDGSYLVDGRTAVDDLLAEIPLKGLPEGDFQTVAGLVLSVLERIPTEGDRFTLDAWTIEVIDMDGRRIDKLLFIPPRPSRAAGDAADDTVAG